MNRGGLLAGLALCAALPLQAQERPEWFGVWEGRIGELPVRACFDSWTGSAGRGSYYYLRHLEPIALREEPEEGNWVERAPGSEAEAAWHFAELSSGVMRGTWRQGRRSLPFWLRPAAWDDANDAGPCGSAAFLAARLEGGTIVSERARSDVSPPFPYTRHRYRPPAHLGEDVSVTTFTIAEEQPGDVRINEVLRGYLPRDTAGDNLHRCLGGAIASLGTDGSIEHRVEPILLSRAFLALEETSSTFCGGAHPNHWTAYRTFDRATGEEVDLFDWFGNARAGGGDTSIPGGLRALVFARWPASDSIAECRELFQDAQYWSVGLRFAGLVFRPDFPHAATPCEESILIGWQSLAPFLDEQGRDGVDRLRAPSRSARAAPRPVEGHAQQGGGG